MVTVQRSMIIEVLFGGAIHICLSYGLYKRAEQAMNNAVLLQE